GLCGLFLGFIGLVSAVNTLNYEMAIPSAETEDEAVSLLTLCMVLAAPVSLVFAVALAVMQRFDVLGYGSLPGWLPLLAPPVLVFTGFYQALRFFCVRSHEFQTISRCLIQQGTARALSPILLGFFKTGFAGLAFGESIGRVVGVGSLFRSALPSLRRQTDTI